jgi:hypothetical protein
VHFSNTVKRQQYGRFHDNFSSLQLYPQLQRLGFLDADPLLHSPPSVAQCIAVARWRKGRSPRRCHCRHRLCRSLLSFPQVRYYRYQPNISTSISELTLDSKLVPSTIISCCLSDYAECCLAQLAALELVEDTGLLLGRFAASFGALRARGGWQINIRDGVKVDISGAWM